MNFTILIVDDDPFQRRVLDEIVRNKLGYNTILAGGGREAVNIIMDNQTEIDLVLLDITMPDMDGREVLKIIKPKLQDLPVIIVTIHDDVSLAVQTVRAGAIDFVTKDSIHERLEIAINNALKLNILTNEVSKLERKENGQTFLHDIVSVSKPMSDAKIIAERAAQSSIPVFIEGESGVGKELFARAIHGCSERMRRPFITVNCGAIPENLVESVLFGHEKGAFTGATYKNLGKFREADGGTLFLDEVGELKPEAQAKLLRVLQEKEVDSVGSSGKPQPVDVRIISATNRNLEHEVRSGKFREDLYYRLKVFPLAIPSLRNRKEDISILADTFCKKYSALEKKSIMGITHDAKEVLMKHTWPGNVRELQNYIYKAVVLCDKRSLEASDFDQLFNVLSMNDNYNKHIHNPHVTFADKKPSALSIDLHNKNGGFRKISDLEAEIIRSALEHYNWHISNVARALGIGRSTLYRKMAEIGIKHPKDEDIHDPKQQYA